MKHNNEAVFVDIRIHHIAGNERIDFPLFPEETKLIWRTMASRTRRFLGTPEIMEILTQEKVQMAEELIVAQDALDRLGLMPTSPYLTLIEASHVLNLVIGTIQLEIRRGIRWDYSKIMLEIIGHIARCELYPLTKVHANGSEKEAQTLKTYEVLRRKIGTVSSWISFFQMYEWWLLLKDYRSNNLNVLEVVRELDSRCKRYHAVYESL